MSLDKLQVYTKTSDYMCWLFPITTAFPKAQRFVLAQRIENTVLSIIECIIESNASRQKVPLIRQALTKLEVLQVLMRFAKDQRFVSLKQYEISSQRLAEIGRLLGGWMRQARQHESRSNPHAQSKPLGGQFGNPG
ncbi:diversity-generating retroelement protein Avd [Candidatus Entotheonella palauensis]|uniref:bAvd-like domain-containing protein n=1 Tax=Candidatus Entotheonella gemina TaxID=1429439 RepID=W4LUB5_9BACT|nr:diversity-generating retroelement protein Avd [Candidatus Entotheonella palauensis]ETX01276.1 MAG: hypothetical protein ETSY2_37520 [Candidatus Entotheonella gemina]